MKIAIILLSGSVSKPGSGVKHIVAKIVDSPLSPLRSETIQEYLPIILKENETFAKARILGVVDGHEFLCTPDLKEVEKMLGRIADVAYMKGNLAGHNEAVMDH